MIGFADSTARFPALLCRAAAQAARFPVQALRVPVLTARFCVAKTQQENWLARFSNRKVPVREQTLARSLRRNETVRSETVE